MPLRVPLCWNFAFVLVGRDGVEGWRRLDSQASVTAGQATTYSDFVFFRNLLIQKFTDADDRSAHRAAADFLNIVARSHPQSIETSVEGFEHSVRLNARANTARRAVLNIYRRSHRDFIPFAVGMQRVEGSSLHQSDHVRRGINRRQLLVVRRQRVLELDRFVGLAARRLGFL